MKRVPDELRLPMLRHLPKERALAEAYAAWEIAEKRLQQAKRYRRGVREATMHELRAARRVRALERILC